MDVGGDATWLLLQMLNQSSVSVSHKDIAARQAGSSIFPWQQQQDKSHGRMSQDVMETPLKRRGASLWEAHEETPIKSSVRMSCPSVPQSPAGSSQQMEQLKSLNQGSSLFMLFNFRMNIVSTAGVLTSTTSSPELRGRVSELERSLSSQEKEICSQASKLQELQAQLNQARKELTERDRDVVKTRHELSQATDKQQQLEAKVGFLSDCDDITSCFSFISA